MNVIDAKGVPKIALEPKVLLAVPVFNEQDQLELSVRELLNAARSWTGFSLEIVIANNGSTDGTTLIAERLARSIPSIRHEHLSLKGRGRALRQVWMNGGGKTTERTGSELADIFAYMDVDLSTDLSFFPSLIHSLVIEKADVAVGSRLLRPEWTTRGLKREFISRSYNKLLRFLFRAPFSDAQCGFKAITKKAAQTLLPLVEDNAWFFDTELLLLAGNLGFRIHDQPVRWKDDPDSRVRIIPTIIQDLQGILRMKRRLGRLPKTIEHIPRSASVTPLRIPRE